MKVASAISMARQVLRLDPPWWKDVIACYGVTQEEARRLGQRANGRRPDFPAGPKGRTYEEVWASRPRDTVADIIAFYGELGSWPVFRQVYRHRFRAWPEVARALPSGGFVLEYGCGVAPVTWWLAQRRRDFHPVLVDVPGQAFAFALRRLGKPPLPVVMAMAVTDDQVPPLPPCDVAVVLETLEHVPSPLAVMRAILEALKPGGVLFEDFYKHSDDAPPSPADLPSARRERPDVYDLLVQRCDWVGGRHWQEAEGGGTRRWRKR